MIVGLTGNIGGGKGTVAGFLKEKGFSFFSLSDELREVLREKGVEITRENLRKKGNRVRKEEGGDILAKRVKKKIEKQQCVKAIIDSIRNPAEIELLKSLPGFFLISVTASPEKRFERIKKRNRESDSVTWEEFIETDKKHSEEDEKGQQEKKCMAMADYTLLNNGTKEDLRENLEKIINDKNS